MNLVSPERFLIKGVKPQGKAYEETENKDQNFFLFYLIQNVMFNPLIVTLFFSYTKK